MINTQKSQELYSEACNLIPGGVNSPVRAFHAVGMNPLYIQAGSGCKVIDADGNEFIDFVGSWGPLIHGHAHPQIVSAIEEAARKGTSFGAPCEAEVEIARLIVEAFPAMDMVRMVNSGTEAALSAVRLARAFTGRDKIVKFEGCYHGHSDSFLIKAGSGLLTDGVASSPGIPAHLAQDTLVANYNDRAVVEAIFDRHGKEIAALIVEAIPGNMGLVLPQAGYLQYLRDITASYGSLLIMDEVITGFRLSYGGYQNIAGIHPDLSVLGKIIGGGLPVGAYGGKKEIMECIAPAGKVYQAGTLSGNPLAMAAGVASLKLLQQPGFYEEMDRKTAGFVDRIAGIFQAHQINIAVNRIGSMFSVFFSDNKINTYQEVITCDTQRFAQYFRALIAEGVYIPPSQFEVSFVSAAHGESVLEASLVSIENAVKYLKNEGMQLGK
jgi:glutamate-1-semialdehyde 2,1-aminomutase